MHYYPTSRTLRASEPIPEFGQIVIAPYVISRYMYVITVAYKAKLINTAGMKFELDNS